jgi:hypothetical protein
MEGFFLTKSVIPAPIVEAHRSALYWVNREPPFALHVDAPSNELDRLLRSNGVSSAEFLTAWNPYGVEASPEKNASANAEMVGQLMSAGKQVVAGFGVAEDGSAPGEESVLALDLSLDEARQIGTHFKQNAIVWIGEDAVPRLILVR